MYAKSLYFFLLCFLLPIDFVHTAHCVFMIILRLERPHRILSLVDPHDECVYHIYIRNYYVLFLCRVWERDWFFSLSCSPYNTAAATCLPFISCMRPFKSCGCMDFIRLVDWQTHSLVAFGYLSDEKCCKINEIPCHKLQIVICELFFQQK